MFGMTTKPYGREHLARDILLPPNAPLDVMRRARDKLHYDEGYKAGIEAERTRVTAHIVEYGIPKVDFTLYARVPQDDLRRFIDSAKQVLPTPINPAAHTLLKLNIATLEEYL